MVSLKNFERLQELQQQIVWQSVLELEPRTFVPEVRLLLNGFSFHTYIDSKLDDVQPVQFVQITVASAHARSNTGTLMTVRARCN